MVAPVPKAGALLLCYKSGSSCARYPFHPVQCPSFADVVRVWHCLAPSPILLPQKVFISLQRFCSSNWSLGVIYPTSVFIRTPHLGRHIHDRAEAMQRSICPSKCTSSFQGQAPSLDWRTGCCISSIPTRAML